MSAEISKDIVKLSKRAKDDATNKKMQKRKEKERKEEVSTRINETSQRLNSPKSFFIELSCQYERAQHSSDFQNGEGGREEFSEIGTHRNRR